MKKKLLDKAHNAAFIEGLDLNGLSQNDVKEVKKMFRFKIDYFNNVKPFTKDWKLEYIKHNL